MTVSNIMNIFHTLILYNIVIETPNVGQYLNPIIRYEM